MAGLLIPLHVIARHLAYFPCFEFLRPLGRLSLAAIFFAGSDRKDCLGKLEFLETSNERDHFSVDRQYFELNMH